MDATYNVNRTRPPRPDPSLLSSLTKNRMLQCDSQGRWKQVYRVGLLFYTQYGCQTVIVFTLKMESVPKNIIFRPRV